MQYDEKQVAQLSGFVPLMIKLIEAAKANHLAVIPATRDGKPVFVLAAFRGDADNGEQSGVATVSGYSPLAEIVADPKEVFEPWQGKGDMVALLTIRDGVMGVGVGGRVKTQTPDSELADILKSFRDTPVEQRRAQVQAVLEMLLQPRRKQIAGEVEDKPKTTRNGKRPAR